MKISAVGAWRIILWLVIGSGFVPLYRYLDLPAAEGGGFSTFRWAVVLVIVLVQLVGGLLLLHSWRYPGRTAAGLERLRARTDSTSQQAAIYCLGVLFLLACLYTILLAPEIDEIYSRLIFLRLGPVVGWAAFVTALLLMGFGLLHGSLPFRFSFLASFWIFLGLLAGSLLAWTLLARPLIPELVNRAGWNATGVPVIEWQLALAWLGGLALAGLAAYLDRRMPARKGTSRSSSLWPDLALAILLWLLAVLVWQSIEITPSWFVSSRLPPNRELYPYSDARLYDTVAQDALDGAGFRFYRSPYIRRPLHALYMLVLHLAAGQGYEKLVLAQILILAMLPVLMYFLVKAFHNRFSGAMAALLLLIREANAIALAGTITSAHVKVLLVDLLTSMLVMLVVLAAFHWLKNLTSARLTGLGVGGCLGLAMLVRLETSVFIPAVLLLLLLLLLPGRHYRTLWIQSLTFVLGIGLVISPWVARNWLQTGEIFIDSPGHRQSLILQRFTLWQQSALQPTAVPTTTQPALPTPVEDAPPVTPAVEPPSTGANIAQLSLDPHSPRGLAAYFLAHYLNSQVQTILYLPSTFRWLDSLVSLSGHGSLERFLVSCCSPRDYVRRLPFWHRWEGDFPRQSLLPIALNLAMVASGASLMWRRHRWVGLVPAVLWVFYLAAHAIFRNSGGRYILPVDWVAAMYFSIGLAHGTLYLYRILFGAEKRREAGQPAARADLPVTGSPAGLKFISYPLCLLCFLVSLAIPLVETGLPGRFSPEQEQRMLNQFLESPQLTQAQKQQLTQSLQAGSAAQVGRALYPQLFRAGYGAPGYEQGPLSARDYPRLVFFLTGADSSDLALPVQGRVEPVPDGTLALVVLCPAGYPNFPEVLAAGFFNVSGELEEIYYRSAEAGEYACPSNTAP